MKSVRSSIAVTVVISSVLTIGQTTAEAAKLTVELGGARGVTLVGAINRWDRDGNPRRPVDPKAKIHAPKVDAKAVRDGDGKWVFEDLPPGRYDLLIMLHGRVRIEGFQYVPVLEFDPFLSPGAAVEDQARKSIADHVNKSRHYENKVVPLYMAGDKGKSVVRLLVMLIRDKPTSYTPGAGTIRHEIWQYTWQYGGWQKQKRTKVMDRILLQVDELRRWTWLWDARLGGIEVKSSPVTVEYELPGASGGRELKGLYPY